uniref:Coiled-coil domain-containing protein 52 n=1 Tax=Rhabditophanes sp. KR3021 TaxID=114890 RepID=A0AC35TTX7_9BILA
MANRQSDQENLKKKIAQVREVVSTVSNSEVVLALHNFDMNVEKTIRALCEQGVQEVIGDWETNGTVHKKKNRKERRLEQQSKTQEAPAEVVKELPKAAAPLPTPSTPVKENNLKTGPSTKLPPKQQQKVLAPTSSDAGHSTQGDIQAIFRQISQALAEREKFVLSQLRAKPDQKFNFDLSNLNRAIETFGHVSVIKGSAHTSPLSSRPDSKCSVGTTTSQNSIVSGGTDDSGIEQISPFSKKGVIPAATVSASCITPAATSNSFSADQLEEIQRQLKQTLSAQGIDISLVQSMADNGGFHTQQRRRAPKSDQSGNGTTNPKGGKNLKVGKGIQA